MSFKGGFERVKCRNLSGQHDAPLKPPIRTISSSAILCIATSRLSIKGSFILNCTSRQFFRIHKVFHQKTDPGDFACRKSCLQGLKVVKTQYFALEQIHRQKGHRLKIGFRFLYISLLAFLPVLKIGSVSASGNIRFMMMASMCILYREKYMNARCVSFSTIFSGLVTRRTVVFSGSVSNESTRAVFQTIVQ